MEDTRKEPQRIPRQLLTEEEQAMSLDELLADEELNQLIRPEPAFDDPEKIHDPEQPLIYNNYANNYGEPDQDATAQRRKKHDDRVILGLMITASVLCVGIIGILGYWLSILR